jgi:acyl carrier protein
MKIFISWSGRRSRGMASLLHSWLPEIMQCARPWMSEKDIPKESYWPAALADELASSQAGIICVTTENQRKPWLLFEAGALARNFKEPSRVCIYLLGLRPVDVEPGPLTLYQATQAEKDDTWRLVTSLNEISEETRLDPERLRRAFDRAWPDLSAGLTRLQEVEVEGRQEHRTERDLLEETLQGIRSLQRELVGDRTQLAVVQAHQDPTTEIEETIADIWKAVLRLDRVGIYDNFFELGGNSLVAIQIANYISSKLYATVSPSDLFAFQNIYELGVLVKSLLRKDT